MPINRTTLKNDLTIFGSVTFCRLDPTSSIAVIVLFICVCCTSKPRQASVPIVRSFTTTGTFYALSVPDLDASIKWYVEKLDLKVVMQTQKQDGFSLALLDGGGFALELVEYDDAVSLSDVTPPIRQNHLAHGVYKIGVQVDDIDKVTEYLEGKGVEIVMGPYSARGERRSNLAIKDNSGNTILFLGK